MRDRGPGQKGSFGDLRLPVAKDYLRPLRRHRLLVAGAAVGVVLLAAALLDHFLLGGRYASNGPLSSAHASFGEDCASCHLEFASVSAEKCSVCHEKFGDRLGIYTFAAHYLYRSNDFRRLVPSEKETPCHSCHLEHEGREADITRVPDRRCTACHPYGSFGRDHPQFDFAAEEIPDSAALAFPHIHHVREVMKSRQLEDVERACLHCHNPRADGRSFEPIDFDRHCDACHLTAAEGTPRLPLAVDGVARAVGVESLEGILRGGEPGSRWASFANPGEYFVTGSRIRKQPLHHQDPWVLANLRRLRRALYPDAGLADLLRASPDAAPHELEALYEEAIETLEEYAAGLRSRPEPEIQQELEAIGALLERLRRELRDPYTPLDETRFQLALVRDEEAVDAELAAEIEALAMDLTTPCRRCHQIEAATVTRVQKDQRVLRRARFDHRAHIVQARCLDCHAAIPIADYLGGTDPVPAGVDLASIQNLPRIERCRECHRPDGASERCVTCHYFHADKSRRSELLLYLD